MPIEGYVIARLSATHNQRITHGLHRIAMGKPPAPRSTATGRVRGMLPALLEERASITRRRVTRYRLAVGMLAAAPAVGAAACGGGGRQDADEPEGEFPVEIVAAEFP